MPIFLVVQRIDIAGYFRLALYRALAHQWSIQAEPVKLARQGLWSESWANVRSASCSNVYPSTYV